MMFIKLRLGERLRSRGFENRVIGGDSAGGFHQLSREAPLDSTGTLHGMNKLRHRHFISTIQVLSQRRCSQGRHTCILVEVIIYTMVWLKVHIL